MPVAVPGRAGDAARLALHDLFPAAAERDAQHRDDPASQDRLGDSVHLGQHGTEHVTDSGGQLTSL